VDFGRIALLSLGRDIDLAGLIVDFLEIDPNPTT
jgi:hypothetical protein